MIRILIALLIGFFAAGGSYIAFEASRYNLAGEGDHDRAGESHHHGGGIQGAPGPIAGAGLPALAIGYGVYWLVRRRRQKSSDQN